jgi:hypothetical protein
MTFSLRNALLTLISLTANCQEAGDRFARLGQFRLDEVNLNDIQKILGPSPLIKKGGEGDFEANISYRTRGVFVTFREGYMGAGFSVRRLQEISGATVPKAKVRLPVSVAGLHLGMTKQDFERVVAKKVEWSGDVGKVIFKWKLKLTQADIERMEMAQEELKHHGGPLFFDVLVFVDGTFSSNHLESFQVWKVTSF